MPLSPHAATRSDPHRFGGPGCDRGGNATRLPPLRPYVVLTWGATPDEVERRLRGDELLDPADIVATRAIGIDAPPSAIWPWLVQMGPGRAGAYTYDSDREPVRPEHAQRDRIVPEWQQLEVGDVLRSKDGQSGMRVAFLEPERVRNGAGRPRGCVRPTLRQRSSSGGTTGGRARRSWRCA